MNESLVNPQVELYYQQFLTSCLMICLGMVILWIWRIKTKEKSQEKSASVMSLAFIVMSFLIYTLKMDFDPLWTKILSITLGLLLLIDMWIRASNYKAL